MEAHRSPIATEAVERIGALYEIEKEIRGRPPDERREVRNKRARPLLDAMRAWLETSLSKLSRKSDTSAAIHCEAASFGSASCDWRRAAREAAAWGSSLMPTLSHTCLPPIL
jgi:hypothetical protein